MQRFTIGLLILLVAVAPARAVQVGWSVDVHQNQFPVCADDFHVWGVVESIPGLNGPVPPTLISQDDLEPYDHYQGQNCYSGVFDQFSYQIGGTPNPNLPAPSGYVGPWPPVNPPYYYFEANWWSDTDCVEFCHWAHFGLKFDVNNANAGYWLQGIWTAEHGAQYANKVTPMVSFSVTDGLSGKLRINNATPYQLGVDQVDLIALPNMNFDINNLTTDYFDAHPELQWTSVPGGTGPVPQYMAPDSFFDVFLETVAVPGGSGQTFGNLQPGQLIISRQRLSYDKALVGIAGTGTDYFWQYEIHEVVPEPSSIVMLLCAAGAVLGLAWRKIR
jgi:hypothetical protein